MHGFVQQLDQFSLPVLERRGIFTPRPTGNWLNCSLRSEWRVRAITFDRAMRNLRYVETSVSWRLRRTAKSWITHRGHALR
jgi:hypothetical protein